MWSWLVLIFNTWLKEREETRVGARRPIGYCHVVMMGVSQDGDDSGDAKFSEVAPDGIVLSCGSEKL